MITREEVSRREWRIPTVETLGVSDFAWQVPIYKGFKHAAGEKDYVDTPDIPDRYQAGQIVPIERPRRGEWRTFFACPQCGTVVNPDNFHEFKIGAMHCPTCAHVLLPENQLIVENELAFKFNILDDPKAAPYYQKNLAMANNQKSHDQRKKTSRLPKAVKIALIIIACFAFRGVIGSILAGIF